MPKSFTKRIAQPGRFKLANGKTVDVSEADLRHWAESHETIRDAGFYVPLPVEHDESAMPTTEKPTRHADKAWVGGDGWLTMTLVADTEDDEQAISEAADVSLAAYQRIRAGEKEYENAIGHVALTKNPVVKGQGSLLPNLEQPVVAMSIAMSQRIGDVSTEETHAFGDYTDGAGQNPVGTDGGSGVIDLLRQYGIDLPPDTGPENIFERLVVALTALLSQKNEMEGKDVTEAPPGSKVAKPSPVAMSETKVDPLVQVALSLLGEKRAEGEDEITVETLQKLVGKEEEKVTVQMSESDQAMVNASRAVLGKQYKERIERCVDEGKITPKTAIDAGQPLLDNLQIQFSEGELVKQTIDYVLEAWEAIPAGSVLTGMSPTGYGKNVAKSMSGSGSQFSLDVSGQKLNVEQMPEVPTGRNEPMSTDEVEKVVQEQFAIAGESQ